MKNVTNDATEQSKVNLLGTDPPAGSFYETDQSVAIIISWSHSVEIPSEIQGTTLEEATQLIEEVGLAVGQVTSTYSEEIAEGFVIGSLALQKTYREVLQLIWKYLTDHPQELFPKD